MDPETPVETTAERTLKGAQPYKRSTGRRWQDHIREKSGWLLVIGVLMQGGFILFARQLLTMGEAGLERERVMLDRQHAEMVLVIRDLTVAVRESAVACQARGK